MYDRHSREVADFHRETGVKKLLALHVSQPIRMDEVKPQRTYLWASDIDLQELRRRVKDHYYQHGGDVSDRVSLRSILPTWAAAKAHTVRWETPPSLPVYSCFARCGMKVGEVVGVLCGCVRLATADEEKASPLVFFLSDAKLRMDCRVYANELAFVLPPEGHGERNCQFVSCFVQGLPSLALVAVRDIQPKEELLAPRDANYWEHSKEWVVEHLCRYVWEKEREVVPLGTRLF